MSPSHVAAAARELHLFCALHHPAPCTCTCNQAPSSQLPQFPWGQQRIVGFLAPAFCSHDLFLLLTSRHPATPLYYCVYPWHSGIALLFLHSFFPISPAYALATTHNGCAERRGRLRHGMWIVRSWRSCLPAPGCCDSSHHWIWRRSTLPRGVGESGRQRDSNGQTRTTQLTIGLQQLLLSDTYLPGTLDEIANCSQKSEFGLTLLQELWCSPTRCAMPEPPRSWPYWSRSIPCRPRS